MKNIIEVIAKSLVDDKEQVVITETETEEGLLLELSVAKEDMGKVIGRAGKIAKSIRSIVKALSVKEGKKVIFEIR